MNDLDYAQEEILTQCLVEMDAGASADDCLARHAEQAGWLRPVLEVRRRLARVQVPEPHPAAYAVGREALLGRLAPTLSLRQPGSKLLAAPWLRSRVARAAAAGVLVFALAGGALGASAAAGVGQARDALSALHIVESAPQSGATPQQGPVANNVSGKSSTTEPGRSGPSNGSSGQHGSSTPISTVPMVNPAGECVMLPSNSDVVQHPEKHTDWHAQGGQCRTPTVTPGTPDDSNHTPGQAPAATPTEADESGDNGGGPRNDHAAFPTPASSGTAVTPQETAGDAVGQKLGHRSLQ